MAEPAPTRFRRLGGTFGRLSPALAAFAGIALLVGAGAAGEGAEGASNPGLVSDALQERPAFTHADHEDVQCVSCHTSGDSHGATDVSTLADCRACHHRTPNPRSCASCHEASEGPTTSFQVVRAVSFSVGTQDPQRSLTFPHGEHSSLDCAGCHTEGAALAAPADLDCQSCHEEHHTPESTCASCHVAPPVEAHPPSEAHVTCSGVACHQRFPFPAVQRTRAFCLGCHQNMTEHEAPRACAECHTLPAPRPQVGGGA
jgi:hypothetical protein